VIVTQKRSSRPDVRNPILALPEVQALLDLPPESRAALASVLTGIARTKREMAEHSWRRNKGPMALYHKIVGVYAGHTARVLNRSLKASAPRPWPS
jgi:hypothetical protein